MKDHQRHCPDAGARGASCRCILHGLCAPTTARSASKPERDQPAYRRLYGEHYHAASSEDPLFEQGTLDVHSDEERLRRAAALRLDEIEAFVRGGRFLEVGFGSGHTLREARSRGWDVCGIELAQICVDAMLAQGIPATCAELPCSDGPAEAVDVVGMFSVIEHTHHPDAYLERAHALLKPGGVPQMTFVVSHTHPSPVYSSLHLCSSMEREGPESGPSRCVESSS